MKAGPLASSVLGSLARSGVAGAAATVPMTAAMEAAFRLLPKDLRYPLPPRQVTDAVDSTVGGPLPDDETAHLAATLVAHIGYGAAAGSPFGLIRSRSLPTAFVV